MELFESRKAHALKAGAALELMGLYYGAGGLGHTWWYLRALKALCYGSHSWWSEDHLGCQKLK